MEKVLEVALRGTKHAQCAPPAENALPRSLHLSCPPVCGKQEQKCPDGIPAAHCVARTMSDVPDRAGAGAEAQPSNNAAIPPSPASCTLQEQPSEQHWQSGPEERDSFPVTALWSSGA